MAKTRLFNPILVTSGVGEGPTELAAFDAALFSAGIANYNLIPLSSVIPVGFKVARGKPPYNGDHYGDRLYVVLAQKRQSQLGNVAAAGLGWMLTTDGGPSCGLFVEHEGGSAAWVGEHIRKSLTSMCEYRPEKFGRIHTQVASVRCKGAPVCALVAAVYSAEGWE